MWRVCLIFALLIIVSPSLAQTEDDRTACDTAGLSTQEIAFDGDTREYDLYVPDGVALPAPLVMSLHGFGGNPAIQREIDGWTTLADEAGFVVAYPRGTGFPLRWNTGDEGFRFSTADDVGFLNTVLDDLDGCITEVYAVGFSNGGGMVNRLACEFAERVTAIGTVAGAYGTLSAGCNPSEAVPLISLHGKVDVTVPYTGADTGLFTSPDIETWFGEWAERNTCDITAQTTTVTDTVDLITYDDCAAPMALYTVENGDHVWFGSDSLIMAFGGVDEIDATREMWVFFESLNEDT